MPDHALWDDDLSSGINDGLKFGKDVPDDLSDDRDPGDDPRLPVRYHPKEPAGEATPVTKECAQENFGDSFVLLIDDDVLKVNTCHNPSGGAKGGQFCSSGGGGVAVAGGEVFSLKTSKQRAFTGQQIEIKTKLSKQEAGTLGEKIAISYLKHQGFKDARPLNNKATNFPVDMVQDHAAIEVKTGLVSNGPSAQKWRATIGQPGKKETEWLRKASPEQKAAHNQKKMEAILVRKQKAVQELSKELGKKVKGETLTMIINPDTRRADIFRFSGFHLHIRWNGAEAKKGYVGTVEY